MNNYIASNIRYLRRQLSESQSDFAKRIGLNRDNIASYERGTEPRLEAINKIVNFFHLSFEDFIHTDLSKTKSEENLTFLNDEKKTKSEENLTFSNGKKKGKVFEKNKKCTKCHPLESSETPENTNHIDKPHLKFQLRTDHNLEIQHIPLYNIEAVAGLIPLFAGNVYHTDEYIQIPNLPRCDGAIYITGDSMYPLLKSGDIVLYKQINDIANNIFYGEMYLISIDMEGDEYVTVKYIQKSEKEGHIILVSYNKAHSDKEIHINSIKALAFVKASIRINAMA